MSQFELVHPKTITSDKFEYNGAKFTITADSVEYSGHNPEPYVWAFFRTDIRSGSTQPSPPPHWICLSCDKYFITDQFNFRVYDDVVNMTIKDYFIEVSDDKEHWTAVYRGTIPRTNVYDEQCKFNAVMCKHIRLRNISTYDDRGYAWIQVSSCRVYGKLAAYNKLYKDKFYNMYGYIKEEEMI